MVVYLIDLCVTNENTIRYYLEFFKALSMQFELCRHCGEETMEVDKCKTCQRFFKFVCPECNVVYEEFHTDCADDEILEKIVID